MDVVVNEFPFVSDLPKSEVKQVKSFWDEVKEMAEVSEANGFLVPPVAAAEMLGVSRARITQFQQDGRLRVWTFRGRPFVCGDDIVKLAEAERNCGTRLKTPQNLREAAAVAIRAGRATLKKS